MSHRPPAVKRRPNLLFIMSDDDAANAISASRRANVNSELEAGLLAYQERIRDTPYLDK